MSDPGGAYVISVPEGWKVEQQAGSTVAIGPGHKANLMVMALPVTGVPFQQFVQMMVRTWKQQVPGWTEKGRQAVNVSGHTGILIRAEGAPGGIAMTAHYMVVEAPGRNILLSLSCPKAQFPAMQALFGQIESSLQLGGGGPAPAPQPGPQPEPRPQPQPMPQPARLKQVADPGGAFAFGVPADWQAQQQQGVAAAADPTGQANAMAMAAPRAAGTLQQFAQQMIAGWRQQVPNWTQTAIQNTRVGPHAALHIRATGNPEGTAMVADYLVVVTERFQVCFMVSCPQAQVAQRQAVLQQVLQSLTVR